MKILRQERTRLPRSVHTPSGFSHEGRRFLVWDEDERAAAQWAEELRRAEAGRRLVRPATRPSVRSAPRTRRQPHRSLHAT